MPDKVPTEHAEQRSFVQWLYREHPDERFFAIPNGGHRHAAVAKKMKLEGQQKGVPDLFFPRLRLFIEMKRTKGGVLGADQKAWRDYLLSTGYCWILARGAADAVNKFLKFLDKFDGDMS